MNEQCEPLESLLEAAALPVGHVRRDHVDGCARCGARLAAHVAFLSAQAVPADARPDRAERQLSGFLRTEVRGERATVSVSRTFPRLGFAAGTVALAAVLALLVVVPRYSNGPDALPVLRGTGVTDRFAPRVTLGTDGARVLAWEDIEGADDYEVVLFDASLAEIGRVRTQGRTTLTVQPTDSPPLFWRVDAIVQGDSAAASRVCTWAASPPR